MATKTLVTVEEYLTTSTVPTATMSTERYWSAIWGEREHSYIQAALVSYFFARRKAWNLEVYPEQRVQVRENRFRIPDICVVLGRDKGENFHHSSVPLR